MTRSARLIGLMQVLRRHRRPVTAAVLASETAMSVRTIYRDIATLVAQGAPIEGEAGLGYVLRPGFFLPTLMFGTDEVDALILGLRWVEQRGDEALGTAARDALAKIVAVLPRGMDNVAATSGLLAGPAGMRSPHLSVLRQAIRDEEKTRLLYVDKKNVPSDRVVWPVAIGFFEAAEVVSAWCEMRRDFRHFRLDRIVEVTATGLRYPRRHRVLLAEWRLSQGLDDMF